MLKTIASVAMDSQILRRLRLLMSMRCHFGISFAVAPMKCGLSNHLKLASSPSRARVAATAVIIEITVPISSMRAKPLTCATATANRTRAVIAVTTLASMIVWKPLP